jgi:hypothetical protein
MRASMLLLVPALLLAGCKDSTSPRDTSAPAPPRGLRSITGDHTAYLSWLDNGERDLAGYRVWVADCSGGSGCPYVEVGTTSGTTFSVAGLANGQTRYFAVTAFDRSGNESGWSDEYVFDTPRPEGFDQPLLNFLQSDAGSGWDFSAFTTRAWDHAETDMFFGHDAATGISKMFVPDFQTDIQDAGYASSLDAVDFAPSAGWSPSGSAELIVGHCYVVWTRTNHYAKFRVLSVSSNQVVFDWAYQVDPGNRELAARPVRDERSGRRPVDWTR